MLNNLKDVLAVIQSGFAILQALFVIISLGMAARWYFLRRRIYPRLQMTQEVSHFIVSDEKVLLRVKLTFENKGEILLKVGKGYVWLQQIFPVIPTSETDIALAEDDSLLDDKPIEVGWPIIDERYLDTPCTCRELEPGEVDEINIDFLVNNEKTTLLVYTFVQNPKRKDIGWQRATVYEVPDADNEEETAKQIGVTNLSNSNSNNQPIRKFIAPDPDDVSKGGPPKTKPTKVKQPPKTTKKKP